MRPRALGLVVPGIHGERRSHRIDASAFASRSALVEPVDRSLGRALRALRAGRRRTHRDGDHQVAKDEHLHVH
eukprot:4047633-Prymnesium_polylepis.1